MRRVIYVLQVLLLLFCGSPLFAQQYYKVGIRSGAYTELTNPAVVITDPNAMVNEFSGSGIQVPFSVKVFDQNLNFSRDTLFVFAGGFLVFNVVSKQRFYILDGFVSKLTRRDATSSISCQLEGSPGEQVLKVQWKNLGMIGNPAEDFVNLQMWLNEKDNSFEVHVGPHHVTGTAAYFGNNGPAVGGFVSTYDFSAFDVTFHLTGSPTEPGLDVTQIYYPLSATPPEGTIYHFDHLITSAVETENEVAGAVSFRPNPSNDRSLIQLPDELEGTRPTLVLHDALGREALRMEDVTSGSSIAGGTLPAGVYYATFYHGGRPFNAGRLMIVK